MSKRRRSSSSSSSSDSKCSESEGLLLNTSFVDQTPSSPLAFSETSTVGVFNEESASVSLCNVSSSHQEAITEKKFPTSFKGLFQEDTISFNQSFDIEIKNNEDPEQDVVKTSGNPEQVNIASIELPAPPLDVSLEGSDCYDSSGSESESEDLLGLDFNDALSIDSDDDDVLYHDPEENSRPVQPDKLIYQDGPMTINESLLAVLTFAVRHNLNGKAIIDLLKLISLHLKEEENQFRTTLYFFKKHFSHLKAPVKLHYFCSVCLSSLPTSNSECPNLRSHKNKKTQCSYFLEISLEHQLQMLYKRKGILESILSRFSREKKHPENIEDIYDGQLYKEFVENGFLSETNKYNISLTWNSDGVPVFKSTKTSMWPIYFVINELPFKMRFKKSNVLLGGIWYGAKPSANMMLEPFIISLTTLNRGVEVKPYANPPATIIVKGVLLAGTADLPAKADFMGLKHSSGSHSCAICKIAGKSVKTAETKTEPASVAKSPCGSAEEEEEEEEDSPSEGEGESEVQPKGKSKSRKESEKIKKKRVGSVWVFPYEEEQELRRHSETEAFAEQALIRRTEKNDDKVHVWGVKYPTILSKVMPDMIRGMGIDDLHHSYHGVGHKLVELWTLPKYKKMPWSILSKVPLVDDRLQNIKLPNYVQCGVRSLSNLSLWKAHHMKVFILYLALAVLEGVLPTVYLDHFSIFVNCIFILNSSSISPAQLLMCSNQLQNFVKQFQELYGERHMTINVHNTLHLCFVVNNLGPLRCYSCFPFESLNGEMLKMVHGTKYVQMQLANCAYMIMSLPYELSCVTSQSLSNFTKNIHHTYQKVKILEEISTDTFAAGNYIDFRSVAAEVRSSLAGAEIDANLCKFFTKLKKGAILFVAKSYTRSTKTASYLISYKEGDINCYGHLLQFIKVSCSLSCVKNCANHPAYLAAVQNIVTRRFSDYGNVKKICHMLRYTVQDIITFINVSQLKHICFLVNVTGKDPILCKRVNWLEME